MLAKTKILTLRLLQPKFWQQGMCQPQKKERFHVQKGGVLSLSLFKLLFLGVSLPLTSPWPPGAWRRGLRLGAGPLPCWWSVQPGLGNRILEGSGVQLGLGSFARSALPGQMEHPTWVWTEEEEEELCLLIWRMAKRATRCNNGQGPQRQNRKGTRGGLIVVAVTLASLKLIYDFLLAWSQLLKSRKAGKMDRHNWPLPPEEEMVISEDQHLESSFDSLNITVYNLTGPSQLSLLCAATITSSDELF